MWSDGLFSIPKYINEFELKHFCFGDDSGEGAGGTPGVDDQGYALGSDDTSDDNSVSGMGAGFGGDSSRDGIGSTAAQIGAADGSANPADEFGTASTEVAGFVDAEEPGFFDSPFGLLANIAMALLAPPAFAAANTIGSLAGKSVGSAVSSAFGEPNPSEFGLMPNFSQMVSSANPDYSSELADISEISQQGLENFDEIDEPSNTNFAGLPDDDMMSLEGPSILTPVAPVSAMQRVPNAQQQIAQALLQPSQPIQGRPGYTRANTKGPIYFT